MDKDRYVLPEDELARSVNAIQKVLVNDNVRMLRMAERVAERADKTIEFYQKKRSAV